MSKFDKREVLKSIRMSENVPMAMLTYISRNGCSGFRCRECPLGLVCTHVPGDAPSVALDVMKVVRKRMKAILELPSQPSQDCSSQSSQFS